MRTVGLITEYNPFHNGHQYHLQKAKEITNADYVIVVMSGNFLQRGVPAIINKYARTRMALENGADLVIELPVIYSCASAEFFSYGGISLLDNIGITDSVCFGSECGDISLLKEIAHLFRNEPERFRQSLRTYLKKGLSFPSARVQAAGDYLTFSHTSAAPSEFYEILSNPNNILGIEYLKALSLCQSKIVPYTLLRKSAGYHETELTGTISSATAIRNKLSNEAELETLKDSIPFSVYSILKNEYKKTYPIFEDDFSAVLKYSLLTKKADDYTAYADVSSDFAASIAKHLNQYNSFTSFAECLKNKQWTRTRINRALIHIMLGICQNDLKDSNSYTKPGYARILGFREASAPLLSKLKANSKVPMISKLANAEKLLSPDALSMLRKDILAADIYQTIVTDKFAVPPLSEYRQSPIKL